MANIIENEKGFKVIEVTKAEIVRLGGFGICDHCGRPSSRGYYVAVLNRWMCPVCYKMWMGYAVHYPNDIAVEDRNFYRYKELLNL